MEPWKDFDFDDDVDSGSSGSAAVPPTSGAAGLKGAAVAYVMAEDADALDCGICCLPLKPPIFQCNVGHVVCSPCHNKLMGTGKCHLCGINVAGGSAAITSSKYLFLLNVLRKPFGRAISVLLIGRKPSSKAVKCVLTFSHIASQDRKFLGSHLLQSKINVECSDLCSGVPNPDDCFQFVVPDYLLGEGNRDSAIKIKVSISIDDLE
ncbi:hypothetical protein EJB05_33753 [Eragrostis curvula]|uniref:E3 ubiquitin-protein ligase Sina-like RING finger domain-containing protein n=1 Tax=Eragrostis curvula TaxID=38414 RepID=A0A5J9U1X0_9POAL|nr:hypothetical protein EJB05_33753 [Eragrostis curvula]